jgi:radical SAM superfamily enzyme YgiQ (UPF0313 family)
VKIALVAQHADPAFMPLALLYLKAVLVEREGFDPNAVSVLEFTGDANPESIAERVISTEPDVVGFSCYVWNVRALTAAAAIVKRRRPHTRIVLGGPEVGPIATSVLEAHPAVDVIVCSEGELPFAALVQRWREHGGVADVGDIKGIAARSAGGIVETGAAPILQDLNQLPSPHLCLSESFEDRVVCIETQRGCVFRCNFCFYNKDLSIRNRRFDLERVKEEILFWLERDVAEIYLMDPIFNLYADRAKEICRFIAEHNRRGVPFHAEIWAEFVDDELARLMRDANFEFLEVGLQSTDEGALATVERRLKLQKFKDGIGWLKKYGLKWELQLIFGLPGETRDSFRRSLNFANVVDAPELAVYPLMVLPGTELWRKAADMNLEFEPQPPYFVRSHFSMSADDVAYGVRVVDALQEIGDSRTVRMLGREPGLSYPEVIDAWLTWVADHPDVETTAYRIKQFVVDFCSRRGIDSGFYRGFASWELAG